MLARHTFVSINGSTPLSEIVWETDSLGVALTRNTAASAKYRRHGSLGRSLVHFILIPINNFDHEKFRRAFFASRPQCSPKPRASRGA